MSGRHAAPRRTTGARRAERGRGPRPWTPAVVALIGALGLVGGLGTQAFWTDQVTVTGDTVQSGSLTMTVNGQDTDTYTWAALGMSSMAPGESRAALLTIANTGTTPFRISGTGEPTPESDGGLRSKMRFTIRVAGSPVGAPDATYPRTETCSGGNLTWDLPLSQPGPDAVVPGSVETDVAAGGSLVVCVQATLESNSDNSVQNKTVVPRFVFTATQQAVS